MSTAITLSFNFYNVAFFVVCPLICLYWKSVFMLFAASTEMIIRNVTRIECTYRPDEHFRTGLIWIFLFISCKLPKKAAILCVNFVFASPLSHSGEVQLLYSRAVIKSKMDRRGTWKNYHCELKRIVSVTFMSREHTARMPVKKLYIWNSVWH